MFWIHGGASRYGSGGESIYLSSKFAEKEVILVTTNYRLGSLGWFAHPKLSEESVNNVSGNYGSLDMIAALEWVKNNIEAFGGDPNNVTIFGESAGGQAVGTLLSSPFSKDLFHKAISQSGSGIFTTRKLRNETPDLSGEEIGLALADHFGVENDESALKNLRNIPATEFMQLSDPFKDQELIGNMAQVSDGYYFPYSFHEAYRNGTTHNVPYITGFNANEGTSLFPLIFPKKIFDQTISSEDWLSDFWQSVFANGPSSTVPEELREYEKNLGLDRYNAAAQIWGDIYFGGPAYFAAQKRSEDGLETYLYFFSRSVPSEKQTLDATHALDIAYLFGSFFPFVARNAWDEELGNIMITDWTDFAKYGKPKENWPKFSPSKPIAKIYGDKVYESKLEANKVFESLAENIDLNL
jgi:para-nitrobenzyl esterase